MQHASFYMIQFVFLFLLLGLFTKKQQQWRIEELTEWFPVRSSSIWSDIELFPFCLSLSSSTVVCDSQLRRCCGNSHVVLVVLFERRTKKRPWFGILFLECTRGQKVASFLLLLRILGFFLEKEGERKTNLIISRVSLIYFYSYYSSSTAIAHWSNLSSKAAKSLKN